MKIISPTAIFVMHTIIIHLSVGIYLNNSSHSRSIAKQIAQ